MDQIHLPTILHSHDVTSLLPEELKSEENQPIVTFSLDKPIRNKILNYRDTISDLHFSLKDGQYCIENLPDCQCHLSDFHDNHHGHIVTGDLRIISNCKLRKLLSKGPNFREPRSIENVIKPLIIV